MSYRDEDDFHNEEVEFDRLQDEDEAKLSFYQTMTQCMPRLVEELNRANSLKAIELEMAMDEKDPGDKLDIDDLHYRLRNVALAYVNKFGNVDD